MAGRRILRMLTDMTKLIVAFCNSANTPKNTGSFIFGFWTTAGQLLRNVWITCYKAPNVCFLVSLWNVSSVVTSLTCEVTRNFSKYWHWGSAAIVVAKTVLSHGIAMLTVSIAFAVCVVMEQQKQRGKCSTCLGCSIFRAAKLKSTCYSIWHI